MALKNSTLDDTQIREFLRCLKVQYFFQQWNLQLVSSCGIHGIWIPRSRSVVRRRCFTVWWRSVFSSAVLYFFPILLVDGHLVATDLHLWENLGQNFEEGLCQITYESDLTRGSRGFLRIHVRGHRKTFPFLDGTLKWWSSTAVEADAWAKNSVITRFAHFCPIAVGRISFEISAPLIKQHIISFLSSGL